MKTENIRKFFLPPGPILALTLIGLMLLSALLYYRSVRIQRFLEPALAMSEPRLKFGQNINDLISKEFGAEEIDGIKFKSNSIFVRQSLLFTSSNDLRSDTIKKLANIFLSALNNPDIRKHISIILVSARMPINNMDKQQLLLLQQMAGQILEALYASEPKLEKEFNKYFGSTALTSDSKIKELNLIEFRIVPSEQLHIEVLQRLMKYAE
jgi:hypothetical protein